ncbi:MAG: hypothetical protein HOP15_16140 [Planctomycetes bacterium]|nr:hypothetical protein [Planctomycetota bacterium]
MIPTRFLPLVVLTLGLAAHAQQAEKDLIPRSDPLLRAGILGVLDAKDEVGQRRALEALRAQAGNAHERLVLQLFLLLQTATDTREAMLAGFVIQALPIPPEHVIRALVPLLESEDRALRAAVGNVLGEFEHRSLERGANFSAYRPLLVGVPAPGLVRHLFETDAGAALLELAHLEVSDPTELRALLLAEHEVTDALWKLERRFVSAAEPAVVAELAALARHPRWWARRYAAEVARREPVLRAAVPLEELRRDAHPLVRAAAEAVARQER